MANYFIFAKTINIGVSKIAENDSEKNYFLKFFPEGKTAECNDIDFVNVKKGLKICSLDASGNVILTNNTEKFTFTDTMVDPITNENLVINRSLDQLQNNFKIIMNNQITEVSSYVNNYPNDVVWNSYLNKLKSINVNNVNFPIEKSFQTWFLEQENVPDRGLLQLP
jgi:phosphorylcholine metabolism protein LicD